MFGSRELADVHYEAAADLAGQKIARGADNPVEFDLGDDRVEPSGVEIAC